jgi:hypothetical protein
MSLTLRQGKEVQGLCELERVGIDGGPVAMSRPQSPSFYFLCRRTTEMLEKDFQPHKDTTSNTPKGMTQLDSCCGVFLP